MAKTKRTNETENPWLVYRAILWAVLAGGWILLVASLASYDPQDPPAHAYGIPNEQIHNWVGQFGALVAHKVYLIVGPGAWVGLTGLAAYLVATAAGVRVRQLPLRAAGLLIMTVAASSLIGIGLPVFVAGLESGPEGPGGLLSLYINTQLVTRFAVPGTMVILAVGFWVGALLAMDEVVLALPRAMARTLMQVRMVAPRLPRPAMLGWPSLPRPWVIRSDRSGSSDRTSTRSRRRSRTQEAEDDADEVEIDDPDADEIESPPATRASAADSRDDDEEEEEDDGAADAPGAYVAEKKGFDPEALRAKISKLPINFAPRATVKPAPPREPDLSGYQFPGMDLLLEPESNFTQEMEQIVRQQAVELESALRQYRIEGEVVGIDSGPVITLFEVRLAPGTKVAQISAVDSDLARALKAQNIRIVPNMAGKDTIGIEVPNLKKEKVRLKELMAAVPDVAQKMKLPMFLGKDASGAPLIQDLAAMPHMLIAGTTGSGKSVCMNSIIMSFLYTRRPDELRLVLVDPKMVEMSQFKDIPHLMCPVVTEMSKAASILEWAVTKMDERYELLAEAGVRDIASYNTLSWEDLKDRFNPTNEEEEARIPKKLPYMVFVIDELADLMMTNKEVESFIVRIAQKARAVGIHLILATQRPQANVVTGLIKSNMPCRVAFKVASGMDSRIVLDQKGGELLLGQGDMLFLSPRSSKLTRAQGTLVDDSEIRKTVKFLKEVAQQHFEPQLVQLRSDSGGGVDESAMKDPLFEEAVKIVIESQRGSVSLLQRRLTIGYGRASRLIEAMAAAGILGQYKGSQAREVTITLEEWEAMKAQIAADEGQQDQAAEEEDFDDESVPDEFDDEYKQ
ncbi:MAG TPA: DNA translocase FtsK 4TM domain-containing protein [Phycisphaeraceae bacterium]